MKSLICKKPYQLEYAEIDPPPLQPGHAIIRVRRIGICGTDLHAFEGTQPYFSYPRVLGHELAGDLIDFDDANGLVPGDPVTVIPYFNCGICIACRNNKPNCCVNIKVFGVHVDGGMAQYISVPSNWMVNGEGLSYDELALVEPLAIGAHGIRRAEAREDEYVLVIGSGPIGIAAMEFAKIAGSKVIAMDKNEKRLQFCKDHLGVSYVINATDKPGEQLREITHDDMPTVVIDATGNQQAINNALQYLAHGGRYILIGLQKNELIFSHPEFHKRETTLMSSRNATRRDFEYVIDCMRNNLVKPAAYITHRVEFTAVKAEFPNWLNPVNGVIKAMVEIEH